MIINNDLLTRFREARFDHNSAEAFSGSIDEIKAEKRRIWSLVRSTYNISESIKLKVELDGELAGELRYKDTGEVYLPYPTALGAYNDPESNVTINTDSITSPSPSTTTPIDGSRLVIIDNDGIAHICESVEDVVTLIDTDSFFNSYRVAAR